MGDRGIRKQRVDQILGRGNFVSSGGITSGLIESARLVFLQMRSDPHFGTESNFLTLHGPSAIILAVTAFECSLNEILHTCLWTARPEQRAEYQRLAEADSFIEKFRTIPAFVTGHTPLENSDLELVQQVRHEII